MVNILVIESDEGEGILNEVVGFLSSRAQCRVTNLSSRSEILTSNSTLSFLGLEIKLKEQTVCCDGELIPMSHHEFFTLLFLAQHPNWVFSKEQIYEAVWKESGDGGAAVVNVVSQIRKKIGDRYIKTVINSGYKFEV